MANCCLCNKMIESEDAPLLSISAAGNHRYLCDDCAKLLDSATLGRDPDEIQSAMEEIGKIMANGEPDGLTYSTINKIIVDAAVRGKLIKEGVYDFSKDEEVSDEEEFDDIPEQLRETEEDIKKDELEAEKLKKFDKIYNIILIIAIGVTAGVLVWKLIERFLLK